jgi:hypothetical protein
VSAACKQQLDDHPRVPLTLHLGADALEGRRVVLGPGRQRGKGAKGQDE